MAKLPCQQAIKTKVCLRSAKSFFRLKKSIKKLSDEARLLRFLSGEGPDDHGHFIFDYWRMNFWKMEHCHNYIQWMFPTTQRSEYNPRCPIINDKFSYLAEQDTIAYAVARSNILTSFTVYLRFLGYHYGKQCISEGENFAERSKNWLYPGNHNHLRITRVLCCLHLFGLDKQAKAFFRALTDTFAKYPGRITTESYMFWENAANS